MTAPSARADAIRVVIVDDTDAIRALVRKVLDRAGGFDVVGEASDGSRGVEVVRTTRPDLVVLDLAMPVMDGLQALPRMRDDSPGSRIVVLSGFESSAMAEEALGLGAVAYLPKGTHPTEIVATLLRSVGVDADTVARRSLPMSRDQAVAAEPAPGTDGEMLAMIVHELRNQLTAVSGLSGLLAESTHDLSSDEIREYAGGIARGTQQLGVLVSALADARQLESGEPAVRLVPTVLNHLVRQAVIDFSTLTVPHPTELAFPSYPVVGRIDPIRVRQIIANLLSNAAKFSPPDGPIRVELDELDGFGRITVSDEGPGIPPESRERLFRKFERLGSEVPGTGLGLYVSRMLARAQGGDLLLHPSEAGARFALHVPLVSEGSP